MSKNNIVKSSVKPEEVIQQKIFIIRGQKVMLDKDLAELYEVLTKNLNKAVKRNLSRFPIDFMFQLTKEEFEDLRFQIGTSSSEYGGSRYLPYVFTEHGVAMLSSVLNSERAVQMNIFIIRAFIKMRQSLDNYKDLAMKIAEIEQRQLNDHGMLNEVYAAVKQLLQQKLEPKEKIGFRQK
jgi:hypothetical protein